MTDCKELLRWYEKHWQEDVSRLKKEKEELAKLLEEQAEEILLLKQIVGRSQGQLELLAKEVARLQEELRRAKELSQGTLAEPPLGEGFFRHLSQEVALWDQALLKEAEPLKRANLRAWLQDRWLERERALAQLFSGETPDWRRLRTGLVLEWAILVWLEGLKDG